MLTEKNNYPMHFSRFLNMLSSISGKYFDSTTGYRGSYMSAHVLLNLLNELGSRDKMLAIFAFYLFFSTRFYIYHLTLILL